MGNVCITNFVSFVQSNMTHRNKTVTLGDPWYQVERGFGVSLSSNSTSDISLQQTTEAEDQTANQRRT